MGITLGLSATGENLGLTGGFAFEKTETVSGTLTNTTIKAAAARIGVFLGSGAGADAVSAPAVTRWTRATTWAEAVVPSSPPSVSE